MRLPLTKTASLSPLLGGGIAAVLQAAVPQVQVLQSLRTTNPILYQALMAAAIISVLNRLSSGPAPAPAPTATPQTWPLM